MPYRQIAEFAGKILDRAENALLHLAGVKCLAAVHHPSSRLSPNNSSTALTESVIHRCTAPTGRLAGLLFHIVPNIAPRKFPKGCLYVPAFTCPSAPGRAGSVDCARHCCRPSYRARLITPINMVTNWSDPVSATMRRFYLVKHPARAFRTLIGIGTDQTPGIDHKQSRSHSFVHYICDQYYNVAVRQAKDIKKVA